MYRKAGLRPFSPRFDPEWREETPVEFGEEYRVSHVLWCYFYFLATFFSVQHSMVAPSVGRPVEWHFVRQYYTHTLSHVPSGVWILYSRSCIQFMQTSVYPTASGALTERFFDTFRPYSSRDKSTTSDKAQPSAPPPPSQIETTNPPSALLYIILVRPRGRLGLNARPLPLC